jgi:zinc transport system ATP-binding protein
VAQKEIVNLKNIQAGYNGTPAIEDINLSISKGDFLAIIGPNGGGKTTLLKVILGLLKPTRGSALVLGKPPQESRGQIGYVPQHNLFDRGFPISVWETVLMGRYSKAGLFKRYRLEDKEMATKTLKTVGMLKHKAKQLGSLSGGQQQRVFIARALVTEPRLLLLDEPTASVDPAMQTEFYELMDDLKKEMAIVLVSHDIGAISVHVTKIACLNKRLYYHGSREVSTEVLEATYQCPIQMITHGTVPHRVLKEH